MSTDTAAPTAGAEPQTSIPNPPAAAAAQPAVPPAPPAIPPGVELFDPKNPPAWFKEKLEDAKARATAQALKDLGVDDLAKAKEAIEKAKAEEEKNKSVAQKLAEREQELKTAKERLDSLNQAVTVQAQNAMAALSADQQQVVRDLAGEDPARQVQVIAKLQPTWAKPAQAAPAMPAAPPAPPPPLPQGATTASPGAAPPAPSGEHPKDHKAIWEGMRATHPVMAAKYLQKHFHEIYKP